MTTVGELRQILQLFPDDALVVLSKDGEGNDFSPLAEVTSGQYHAESSWAGGYESDDYVEDEGLAIAEGAAVRAICLWPTN